MSESYVQVSVVLAQQMRGHFRARTDAFSRQKAEQLDALLSQPTPSAEAMSEKPHAPSCDGWMEDEGDCTCRPATPPSIEDMAPGTTFSMLLWGGCTRYAVRVPESGAQFYLVGSEHYIDRLSIDPSTIRDVTPPKETTA